MATERVRRHEPDAELRVVERRDDGRHRAGRAEVSEPLHRTRPHRRERIRQALAQQRIRAVHAEPPRRREQRPELLRLARPERRALATGAAHGERRQPPPQLSRGSGLPGPGEEPRGGDASRRVRAGGIEQRRHPGGCLRRRRAELRERCDRGGAATAEPRNERALWAVRLARRRPWAARAAMAGTRARTATPHSAAPTSGAAGSVASASAAALAIRAAPSAAAIASGAAAAGSPSRASAAAAASAVRTSPSASSASRNGRAAQSPPPRGHARRPRRARDRGSGSDRRGAELLHRGFARARADLLRGPGARPARVAGEHRDVALPEARASASTASRRETPSTSRASAIAARTAGLAAP